MDVRCKLSTLRKCAHSSRITANVSSAGTSTCHSVSSDESSGNWRRRCATRARLRHARTFVRSLHELLNYSRRRRRHILLSFYRAERPSVSLPVKRWRPTTRQYRRLHKFVNCCKTIISKLSIALIVGRYR